MFDYDSYDMDGIRQAVEEYYEDKYEESKTVEDEIEYIEACWKSSSEIIRMARSIGINIEDYRISKSK